MKTKFLLVVLLFSTNLFAQIVNIPDGNFLHRLLHHTGFGGVHIDTNNNNQIEVSEAEAVTELMLGDPFATDYQIINMTGIEAFKNITSLQCINNQITSLDLSQNTKLEILDCHDNNISSLDVTNCALLREIECWDNNLTSLNVSQNTALEELWCSNNNLNSLDVTQNNLLKILACSNNSIISLDVNQNLFIEEFYFYNNLITNIDISQNTLLCIIFCQNNHLNNLDLTQNTQLIKISFYNNLLTEIDVSQCTLIEEIWGEGNQLINIDFSLNENLKKVRLEDNQLTYLDLRNENNGIVTVFNTTNNPNLTCIFVDDAAYSTENWTAIDPNSTFVETQAECDAIGVYEEQLEQVISVYPNPTNGIINLEYSKQLTELQLLDTQGREIYKSHILNLKSQIDISYLSQGIYYLKIKTNNNQILTHKIIKL